MFGISLSAFHPNAKKYMLSCVDMGMGFSYLIKSLVEGMSTPDDNTFVINVNSP
jgi:hypothetical protein